MRKTRRKFSWLRRLGALLACFVILVSSIVALLVGFTIQVVVAGMLGIGFLIVPAIVEGGGFLVILFTVFEASIDAIFSVFEGIGSLFNF